MITFDFEFRGLRIEAEVTKYDKGDSENPPSGGEVRLIGWVVEDLEAVMDEMEIDDTALRLYIEAYDRLLKELPFELNMIIGEWNLERHAEEHFTHDLRGDIE